jgi:hypothetical protein
MNGLIIYFPMNYRAVILQLYVTKQLPLHSQHR